MTNWMEITGISMQLFAGLIFIIDQIARNFSTSVGKLARGALTFTTGKATRRWRIVTLLSLVALPLIVLVLTAFGTEKMTWPMIGGVLIFTLIGFDSYALFLILVGKKTLRRDISKQMNSLIQGGRLVSLNRTLLIISGIALTVFIYVVGYAQPGADNFVFQILQLLLVFVGAFVFAPTFLFSLFFLVLEGVFRLTCRVANVKHPEYYWIAIAVLWVAGGAFLLAHVLSS